MARRLTPRFRIRAACLALVLGAAVLLPVLGGTLAQPAHATVLLYVPFEEQAHTADTIIVGAVRSVVSQPCPDRPAYFETLVTLVVDDVVAGSVPPVIELRFSGGQIGDIRQSIDGMPQFSPGERYVVFLHPERDPPLISPIVGFNQGLYRVVTDAAGVDVVRDRRGRRLLTTGTAARDALALDPGEPRLHDFVAAVTAARP